jgi:uncharacterized RDD family membrane protein YckC
MNVDVDAAGKLTIETPEQIGIEFEVAGLGSRFLAALVDLLCMLVFLIAAVAVAISAMGGRRPLEKMSDNMAKSENIAKGLGASGTIVLLLSIFLVQWGYYIICEMLMNGASPGKRVMGLRVIRDDGTPLGVAQSLLRNLVRIVDFLPWGYGVGLVAVFVSPRSQRLGDLAAGTLVTRLDPLPAAPGAAVVAPPAVGPWALVAAAPPGAALLAPAQRALVRQFVERLPDLVPQARDDLARAIARPLRAQLGAADPVPGAFAVAPGADADVTPEQAWLVALDAAIAHQTARRDP